MFLASFSLTIMFITVSHQAPTESFPNMDILDANITLYWDSNATTITFEIHSKAHGYTGFGISTNGSMFPGDVIVGFISNNHPTFNDYHTDQHGPPKLDSSQDWTLLYSKETHDETVFKFSRLLDTGDASNDLVIHPGNTHVIWSHSDSDPTSATNLTYHGTLRGSKSIRLIVKDTVPVGK